MENKPTPEKPDFEQERTTRTMLREMWFAAKSNRAPTEALINSVDAHLEHTKGKLNSEQIWDVVLAARLFINVLNKDREERKKEQHQLQDENDMQDHKRLIRLPVLWIEVSFLPNR